MSEEIKIARPSEEDIEKACDIAIRAWTTIREGFRREIGDELYEAFYANWQDEKRMGVRRYFTSGHGYVALLHGAVVGFICYKADEERKTGEICANAVDPDKRGMGIASQMYHYILDEMREKGIKYVKVHTGLDDGHIPARRAYEKMGFEKNLPSVEYFMKL